MIANTRNREELASTCQLFVAAIQKYFDNLQKSVDIQVTPLKTGVPYMREKKNNDLKDFTAMVAIASRNHKGFVYISGDQCFFLELSKFIGRCEGSSSYHVFKMVLELVNKTIKHVKKDDHNQFMISGPILFEGKPEHDRIPENMPLFVIPIQWNGCEAQITIGLE